MASQSALKQELLATIRFMEEERLVDHRLRQVHSLKEDNGPFFLVELIPTYCTDTQNTLREMTSLLEKPFTNYYQLDQLCLKLKGGSSSLGLYRVALHCKEFRQAVSDQSKERCVTELNLIEQEFLAVKDKLETVVELERKIICHEYVDP